MGEKHKHVIPLHKSKKGQRIRIHSMPVGPLRTQFIRIGITEGESAVCFERLPGGTVVLQKNRQQIAIGKALANQILIVVLDDEKN